MSTSPRPQDAEFWQSLERFDCAAVAEEARDWNGHRWADAARMAHASIAGFSKFALRLIAVGAPSELLARAHEAALDEVHHARISFALASKFLGTPLGPDPLPLDGDLPGSLELAALCQETIVAGCIGHSLAAAEASVAKAQARAPVIVAALEIVERDASLHAELAWSFVGWALTVAGPALAPPVREAFEERLAEVEAEAADRQASPGAAYPGFGHLRQVDRTRVRARTATALLRPALPPLLAVALRPS